MIKDQNNYYNVFLDKYDFVERLNDNNFKYKNITDEKYYFVKYLQFDKNLDNVNQL